MNEIVDIYVRNHFRTIININVFTLVPNSVLGWGSRPISVVNFVNGENDIR